MTPYRNRKEKYYVHEDGWYLPTIYSVLQAHEQVLENSVGMTGILDERAIESALAAAMSNLFDSDLYPTLLEKISEITRRLVLAHAFVDGNKRTAYLVLRITLAWNNYSLEWPTWVSELMMEGLANKQIDTSDFVSILEHSVVLRLNN